jgi:hypothetical protein
MGRGTEKSPYTRKDVLRLIKKNGGTAKWLDLSGKHFEDNIDLSKLDLEGIILNKAVLQYANLMGANLSHAFLAEANMTSANLEGACLDEARLQDVNLHHANLNNSSIRNADLSRVYLEFVSLKADFSRSCLWRAHLIEAEFPHDANFEEVYWGDFILGEEELELFEEAKATYHRLKIWHTEHNLPNIAAKFYFREKEAERKGAERRRDRVAGWFSWAFFGYGEGWKRILIWIAGCISFFTLIYFLIAKFCPNAGTLTPDTFPNSLYYSAVSFITLGYGSWIQNATGWVKGLGVFEAFLGFFMMTLLLVTFVRKWTR